MPRSKSQGHRGGGRGATYSRNQQKPVHEAKGELDLTVTTDKGSLSKVLLSALVIANLCLFHVEFSYTEYKTSELIKQTCVANSWACMYNPFLMNKGWTILAPSAEAFIKALKTIARTMAKGVTKIHVKTNESTHIKHEPHIRQTLEGVLDALTASDPDASSDSSHSTDYAHGGPSNSDDDSVSSCTDKKQKKQKGKSSTKQNRKKAVKPKKSDSGDDSDSSASAKKAKSSMLYARNKSKAVVQESADEHDSDAEIQEDVVLISESDDEKTRKPKRSKKDDQKNKSKPKAAKDEWLEAMEARSEDEEMGSNDSMHDFIASEDPLSSDDSARIIDPPEQQQRSRLVKTSDAKKKKMKKKKSGNEEIIDAMHIKKQKRAKNKAKVAGKGEFPQSDRKGEKPTKADFPKPGKNKSKRDSESVSEQLAKYKKGAAAAKELVDRAKHETQALREQVKMLSANAPSTPPKKAKVAVVESPRTEVGNKVPLSLARSRRS